MQVSERRLAIARFHSAPEVTSLENEIKKATTRWRKSFNPKLGENHLMVVASFDLVKLDSFKAQRMALHAVLERFFNQNHQFNFKSIQ